MLYKAINKLHNSLNTKLLEIQSQYRRVAYKELSNNLKIVSDLKNYLIKDFVTFNFTKLLLLRVNGKKYIYCTYILKEKRI